MTHDLPLRLNPTELPTGKRHEQIVELRLPSVFSFDMVRLYRTNEGLNGPLGPDQYAGVDICIRRGPEETYIYTDLSGIPVPFPKTEPKPGAQTANRGRKDLRLEPLPRSGFRVWERSVKQDFSLYPGDVWLIDQLTDGHGNQITFERTLSGILERIKLADGNALEFTNSERGQRLGYDLVAPDGSRLQVMRYAYDNQGRLTLADNHMGASQHYAYDDANQAVSTTDDMSRTTVHRFDGQGRVISVENEAGYHTGQFSYDDRLRQITVSHGDGHEFEKLWFGDEGHHFMTADANGGLSYRRFDDDKQLKSETDANGATTTFRTDPLGNPEAQIDPEGRENFMIWDDNGNLLVEKGPDGAAWRYDYGDDGTLRQTQSPLGHITNFRYNARGQLEQKMRHDGLIEFRRYDAQGRQVSLIDYNSQETVLTHDAFGRVASISDPTGDVLSFHHDDTIKGKPFHMPSRVSRADGTGIERRFHASGDLAAIRQASGQETTYDYGPYNVLEGITDARGNSLRFQYDSRRRLTCVTNQAGRHWTFDRDAAGRVLAETDFDGRRYAYEHDGGGRLTRRVNPDGSELHYTYDASGLVLERAAQPAGGGASQVTTYSYDDAGRLVEAANDDATIQLGYDAAGTVISETVNGVHIESEFDCCGHRIARNFDGMRVTCRFDGMGGLLEWDLDGHVPIQFARDALGRETSRRTDHGLDIAQSWGPDGALTSQRAGGLINRAYDWMPGAQLREIQDEAAGTKQFSYDPNGQIAQMRHGDDTVDRFAYAPDMTIAATADAADQLTWQTTAAGVVKLARGPLGEIVTLEHDDCGRVTQRTVARKGFRPQTWRFGWNALDQLVQTTTPDGTVWTYRYDPFGRRIAKESKTARHQFIWDGDVVAREITTTAGQTHTVDWFYEPDSFRPLARLEGGVLSIVVNDYMGTPKELVGTDGSLHWRADHNTWGSLRPPRNGPAASPASSTIDEGDYWIGETGHQGGAQPATASLPADAPDPAFCPIRFQGQWEDAETGLFYNRHRYYDPLTGSYCSPDPIGVNGGPRPDAYVIWPHILTDPFGLNPCCAARYRRSRPCFRNGVVESVWNTAAERARARGLDYIEDVGGVRIPLDSWSPGDSRVGVWDMGHRPGHEYRTELLRLERGEITPAEFRDIYNNSANYRVEHPSTNRSHKYEEPDTCED